MASGWFDRLMIGNILGGAMGKVAPQGDFESIATVSLSSGQSSIDFNSIAGTWQHLQLRLFTRGTHTVTANDYRMQVNGDTGSNYGFSHYLNGDGGSATSSAINLGSYMNPGDQPANSALASTFGAAVIDILDYKDTNKFKTFRTLGGYDLNGSGSVWLRSGLWRSTSAVTSIKIYVAAGNFATNTHITLYGIKG